MKATALALIAPNCREENPFVSAAADTKDWKDSRTGAIVTDEVNSS